MTDAGSSGEESRHSRVLIVGSGPAGYTAAGYAARAQLAPIVIAGFASGGQLMITTDVENYPGFPDGVMGPELMASFRAQAARFGAEIITEKVTRVDLGSRPCGLWVGDPDAPEPTFGAQALIVSTGARSLMLGLENDWVWLTF